MLGDVKRDIVREDEALIASCHDMRDAVDICLRRGGFTQRGIAAAINVDESYISLMFKGKRYWTEEVLAAITARTGCAAIAQFIAMRYGYRLARPEEMREVSVSAAVMHRSKQLPGSRRAA